MNKCSGCGIQFEPFHYFVQLENKEYVCEQCFFEMALEKFNAKSVKNDYLGNIEENEDDAE